MIYLCKGINEFLFALDTNNVFMINPKSLEVQFIYEVNYTEPQLTCFDGRYSSSKQSLEIFIGNELGVLRIFEFNEILLLQKEINVFPDNHNPYRTKKLD